jgi:hypothetical protein
MREPPAKGLPGAPLSRWAAGTRAAPRGRRYTRYSGTMSENLELVQSVYVNWEHGNWSDDSWADPEIEFVIADGPDPRSITGRRAMASEW